jgi:hypothetical protein
LQLLRPAFGPATLSHHAILLDCAAVGCKQQHHRVIRHFFDEGVGAIGHRNASFGGGGDIDIVDANRSERNDATRIKGFNHAAAELHAFGIDGMYAFGGADEAILGCRAFDDFCVQVLQGLHLVAIATSAVAERGPGGSEDAKGRHGVLLVSFGWRAKSSGPRVHADRRRVTLWP